MSEEVFHTIRHLGRTFTSEQWSDYCAECRKDEGKRIRTKIGKYIWNDFDICLNPDTYFYTLDKNKPYGYNVTIKIAECGNGVWAFGMDYNTGTGGGGFGVSWADKADTKIWNKGFESEKECKRFALRYVISRLHPYNGNEQKIERLKALLQKEVDTLQRPQYVQLSLFD